MRQHPAGHEVSASLNIRLALVLIQFAILLTTTTAPSSSIRGLGILWVLSRVCSGAENLNICWLPLISSHTKPPPSPTPLKKESRSEQSSLRKLEPTRQSEAGVGAWAGLEPPTWCFD